jgi:hypothetical protein
MVLGAEASQHKPRFKPFPDETGRAVTPRILISAR